MSVIAAAVGKHVLKKVLPILLPVVAAVTGYMVMLTMMIAASLGGNTTHHESSSSPCDSGTTTTMPNDGGPDTSATIDPTDQPMPNDGTAPPVDTDTAPASPASPAPAAMPAGTKVTAAGPYREDNAVHSITLTDANLKNIQAAVQVAHDKWPDDKKRSDRAAQIAVMTMAVETEFKNLASKKIAESQSVPNDGEGDNADSVGVYQQRVSGGSHGTVKQIMDVTFASKMFLGIRQDGEPSNHDWGLDDYQRVKGKDWLNADPGDVAADIQRPASSLRYRYALWAKVAADLVAASAGHVVDNYCATPFRANTGSDGRDDYPYGGLPHCNADYTWCPNDGSPLGALPSECVDFALWRINQEVGATKPPFKISVKGNAWEWLGVWESRGWPVGHEPKPGAVVYYNKYVGGAGFAGHEAMVLKVNNDGTYVEEGYNGLGAPNDHKYYNRTVKNSVPSAFLYLPANL